MRISRLKKVAMRKRAATRKVVEAGVEPEVVADEVESAAGLRESR